MSKFEKVYLFVMLAFTLAFSGAGLFFGKKGNEEELYDESTGYDLIGQMYYSCSVDGQKIETERWATILQERGLSKRPILVLWYSSLGCKACNAFALDKIRRTQEKGLPVLIVGADFRDCASTDSEIHLYPKETLGISAEELKIPFLFIYDEEIRHLFFPDTRKEKTIDMYLDTVTMRYGAE